MPSIDPIYSNGNAPTPAFDPISLDNYRYTRAVWWALFAPDMGRHDVLTSADAPAPYRALFDAILNAPPDELVARVPDGPELDILRAVAALPAPRLIAPRRTAAPPSHHPDDDDIDLGSGQWPMPPAHTCGQKVATGTALIMRANETRGVRMFNPTWRTCPACLAQRAKRLARQTLITIAAAGPMSCVTMPAEGFRRWTAATRQHARRTGERVHWRALPQDGGSVFVMSTARIDGAAVPTDRGELHALMVDHANTPDDARVSGSRGYGGRYQRMRGDGRGPGLRLWTSETLEAVAAALGGEVKRGRDSFRVPIGPDDALPLLAAAGIGLHARKGQGSALALALAAILPDAAGDAAADVTLNVQGKTQDTLCVKRDIEGSGGRDAPLLQPPQSVLDVQEVAPWPIYLP